MFAMTRRDELSSSHVVNKWNSDILNMISQICIDLEQVGEEEEKAAEALKAEGQAEVLVEGEERWGRRRQGGRGGGSRSTRKHLSELK